MRTAFYTFLCAMTLGGGGLFAQETAPQQPSTPQPAVKGGTFRAGGEEVLLDVVVRDKKGQPVTNLTPTDIDVYDQGVRRPISSFQLVEGTQTVLVDTKAQAQAQPEAAKRQLDPLRQVRLMTLIFNRLDAVNDRQVARNAALDLIKTELPQNVYASVWVLDQSLKALQEFTSDTAKLRQAIQKATGGGYSQFDAESQQIEQHLQQLVGPSTAGQSVEEQAVGGGTPGNSGPSGATGAQASASQAMAQMMLNMLQLERTAATAQAGRAAITGLLDAVKEQYRLPGRKSIFLFSDGFSVPQGMEEAFRTVISTANRFNVTFYTVDAHGLGTSALNDASTSQLRGAAAAGRAQLSRPADITPQMAKAMDSAIESGRANTQNFLAEVANSTGGFLMANQNDFRSEMRKAVEDIETYYEITYQPGIEKYDGSFRKIELKTDRPGLRLYSRSGYFALPRAIAGTTEVLAPYEVPLLGALTLRPGPRDVPFHSAALHFRDANNMICDIVLDLKLGDIAFEKSQQEEATKKGEPMRTHGEFAYVVLIKSPDGAVIRNFRGDVPLNPTEDQVNALKQSHFFYTEHFALPSGRYTLETAVIDRATDKIGVRKSSFLIPEPNALGISSISVVRSVRDREASNSDQDPFVTINKVITPTLSAVDKGQALSLYAVIYVDPKNSTKPEVNIEFMKDGQNIGGGSPAMSEPDSHGRVQYVATIPLEKFTPGNYEVQFVVKQGTETAREATTFTLEQQPSS